MGTGSSHSGMKWCMEWGHFGSLWAPNRKGGRAFKHCPLTELFWSINSIMLIWDALHVLCCSQSTQKPRDEPRHRERGDEFISCWWVNEVIKCGAWRPSVLLWGHVRVCNSPEVQFMSYRRSLSSFYSVVSIFICVCLCQSLTQVRFLNITLFKPDAVSETQRVTWTNEKHITTSRWVATSVAFKSNMKRCLFC